MAGKQIGPTRVETRVQDRLAGAAGGAIMIGLVGWALISGLNVGRVLGRIDAPLALIDLRTPPPPPEVEKPPPKEPSHAAKGAPSPRNLRARATPVVVPPPPPILLSPPPPLTVALHAGAGLAAANGASDRAGPGEGAGGQGNGTGAGGDGEGDGGSPPEQIRGELSFSDLPADVRAAGIGGKVGVRYHVGIDGRVSGCSVERSSGKPEIDALTCRLIEQRFRFDPSRDRAGRPLRSVIVETHSWEVDRSAMAHERD